MRIKGTQRPRWSSRAKLCWSHVLSDDPAWVVFFWRWLEHVLMESRAFRWSCMSCFFVEDAGTCSHGWLFTLLPRTDYFEWAPSICAFTTLPYPLVLGEQECFAECYSNPNQVLYSIIVNPRSIHACGSCISLGVVASRSIGGGMPGAGGPGGRNVFSIGKAFVGR